MKTNEYLEDLRKKTNEELSEELVAAKKELFNLRFQNATNQLENTGRISVVKKNIARIQTVIVEKKANARRRRYIVERNLRKTRTGRVISDKMDKTIVVAVEDNVQHPLYKKTVKRTYKLKAHDEEKMFALEAMLLKVMETRPLSKDKRWRLVSIIKKAQ